MALEKLKPEELTRHYVLSWEMTKAPSQSEILWENLSKGGYISTIKSWVLLAVLMVVCVILVTPVILSRQLVPLFEALRRSVAGVSVISNLLQILSEHFSTLINLLFNVAIIPNAVAIIT
jgi:hypothetical protein